MKPSSYLPIFIILVTALLSGCAGTMTGSRQHPVGPDNQIQLERDREVTDFWTGRDLTLSYQYHLTGQTLRISGTIILAKHLTHYTVMDHLRLHLYFVDAGGRTMSQVPVYTAPFRRWIPLLNLNFNRMITLPPGAEALAFTYDGKVSDGVGNDDGGISWNFWNAL
jgi:hypothetical protein